MNGITYYRLKSDYTGDYTKNCALNGSEVDNNFYVLEGRDVKSMAVSDTEITITLMNGDVLSAQLDFMKNKELPTSIVSVEFDKLNGVLSLTSTDGTIQKVDGFATNENTEFSVATDNTIFGSGLRNAPLGVAPSARTGQYKTVKKIINIVEGEELPECGNIHGDRYLTCEDVSDFGYLYDYNAVRDIACELQNSGWRIPTKEDWDDLLNAVEPCDCDKTHDKADKNKFLGKWAGKLLKSKTMWKSGDCCDDCGCDCDNCCKKVDCGCKNGCDCASNDTCFDYSDDPCIGTKECGSDCKCESDDDKQGLDAYGFRVTPAGYADDGCNFSYFKERSAFWTATTNSDNSKAYIKRFQYNKNGVYQDVVASNYHLSLRLVKDYDGHNYFDVENIMDLDYPTLLLPSVSKGMSIWTSCNVACANASFSPILPNNGQGLTYTRHYFVNEWDGFKWVRNEVKQGESVVVAKAPNNKSMIEYRVVGNELLSVNEMISKDIIEDANNTINGETEKIIERIETVEKSIEQEITDREDADKKLQEAIDKETSIREAADKALENTISTVNKNLADNINLINDSIKTVNTNLYDAINTINGGIAEEIKSRQEEDTKILENVNSLGDKIKTVNSNLVESIGNINNAIKTVNDNLVTSIDTINGGIDAERTYREEADNKLQEAIDSEAKTREEADDALSDLITKVEEDVANTNEKLQAETDRAINAENELEDKINSVSDSVTIANEEIKAANERIATVNTNLVTAITDINANVQDAINTINGGIDAERTYRENGDKELNGKLLSQEGTEFNSNTGELTLKSAEGTNDVKVQFSFNFGEF